MNLTFFRPAMFLAAVAVVSLTGTAGAADRPAALAEMARVATTSAEHAAVAKSYRIQAEALAEEAVTHERRAALLAASAAPIAHKWSAMAPGAFTDAAQKAASVRRAALESQQLAQRHVNLSVEAQSSAD